MKKATAIILTFALIMTGGVALAASNITNAKWLTTIEVTNTGSTLSDAIAVFELPTDAMVSGGLLSANASDATMRSGTGTDLAFMPAANSSYPWVTWINSIGENANSQLSLYSKDVTGGKLRYFPGDGGMAIADSDELGDNFTIEQKGWIDTDAGADKNLVYKEDAFEVYVSPTVSGNITAKIYDFVYSTLSVDGAGTETNLVKSGAATNWESVLTDDAYTSYVEDTGAAYARDLYTVDDSTGTGEINYVRVYAKAVHSDGGALKTAIRTGGVTYDGEEETLTGDWVSYYTEYALNPKTGLAWEWAEVDAMEIGLSLKCSGAWARNTHVWAVVKSSSPPVTVSATGVSSGEHTVKTTADGTNLKIFIDGVEKDSTALGGASVPDNTNDWVIGSANTTPYMDTFDIDIDGVNKYLIEWEYGTTFTDLSGNGNDATPTFRTASSDADLSASITAQEGLLVASAPVSEVDGGWIMVESVPGTPDDLFTEGADGYGIGGFNIGELITDTADGAGQDATSWHFIFAFGLALMVMFGVYKGTHNMNMGTRGSLWVSALAGGGVLIFFYVQGTIPGFALIPFGLMALGLIVWTKSHSPVD